MSADTSLVEGCNYLVSDNLLVDRDVTLSVPPSVTLKVAAAKYIQVDGSLVATGTNDSPIMMTGVADNKWYGVKITELSGTKTRLSHVVIEYVKQRPSGDFTPSLYVDGAQPYLNALTFQNNEVGARIMGRTGYTVTISASRVVSGSRGITLIGGTNIFEGSLVGGAISGCPGSIIRDNIVTHHPLFGGGITILDCTPDEGFGIVENNTLVGFSETTVAIGSSGLSRIRATGNDLGNSIVSLTSCESVLHENNLGGIVMTRGTPGCEVDATNNWWGTTDTEQIKKKIHDYYDDFNLPKVIYEPFAGTPFP